MSDFTFSLSPSGSLTISERWKSSGRQQQVEITLCGDDVERLRAALQPAKPPAEAGTNAVNWPAIAAYLGRPAA